MQVTLPAFARKPEQTFILAAVLKVLFFSSLFPVSMVFRPFGKLQFLKPTLMYRLLHVRLRSIICSLHQSRVAGLHVISLQVQTVDILAD